MLVTWDGLFSGAMLVSGSVFLLKFQNYFLGKNDENNTELENNIPCFFGAFVANLHVDPGSQDHFKNDGSLWMMIKPLLILLEN